MRERAREERKEWVRSRLGVQGRESLRREDMRVAMDRLERARARDTGLRYGLGYGGTSRVTYSAW